MIPSSTESTKIKGGGRIIFNWYVYYNVINNQFMHSQMEVEMGPRSV